MSTSKWNEIYQQLKQRILNSEYRPGQDFPTNLELIQEFKVYENTIQKAVTALIREGLVLSGQKNVRRKVRPIPHRSTRKGGFSSDTGGKKASFEIIQLELLIKAELLPQEVLQVMEPPVLFYHTHQWLEGVLVAVSRSYIPHTLPIESIKTSLGTDKKGLYLSMREHGFYPAICEESLLVMSPDENENTQLQLPKNSNIPHVHITRQVFDQREQLLEYCFLVDRADCYRFQYRFPL
jgi:GntR family transcriptional regulator